MKLIVVMGVAEHTEKLRYIFKEHKVPVHSEVPIEGFKHRDSYDEAGNWFAVHHPSIYSQLLFAFVEESKATELMNGIRTLNDKEKLTNPIRAFQMNVEQHI